MNGLVSRAKFEKQVELVGQYAAHARLGYEWRILHAKAPRLVLEMPHPGHHPLVLRVYAHDWDDDPASYKFVQPFGQNFDNPLPVDAWPGWPFVDHHRGPFRDDHQPVQRAKLKPGQGPPQPKPFICLRGTRDYHEDRRHVNDRWELHRGDQNYTILAMLISIQDKINTVSPRRPNDVPTTQPGLAAK